MGTGQLGLAQVGAGEIGALERGPAQHRTAQDGVGEVAVAEVGAAELGAAQVSTDQQGILQLGVHQGGTHQTGIIQQAAAQVGTGEIAAADRHPIEVAAGQGSGSEIAAAATVGLLQTQQIGIAGGRGRAAPAQHQGQHQHQGRQTPGQGGAQAGLQRPGAVAGRPGAGRIGFDRPPEQTLAVGLGIDERVVPEARVPETDQPLAGRGDLVRAARAGGAYGQQCLEAILAKTFKHHIVVELGQAGALKVNDAEAGESGGEGQERRQMGTVGHGVGAVQVRV